MMALFDTSDTLDVCQDEIGMAAGQLLTPLTYRKYLGCTYGIDNGAFSNFVPKDFRSLLKRQEGHKKNLKFVAVPDVVGSARRTLEVFEGWCEELRDWPKALVMQDGQQDLSIPWGQIAAVFIGGSTEFKESDHAMAICKAAKALGKWVHVGRVNHKERVDKFFDVADSIDGTGISRYSHMRLAIKDALPDIKASSKARIVRAIKANNKMLLPFKFGGG